MKADAALAVTEAEVNAKEIKAKAEEEAALLFKTATQEASKIIEEARAKAEKELIAARESVDLEQKLYDRIKIEVSDFRKKAATQCAAVIELINQLPDDIGFNIERAKTVLSIDFTNPEELLQNAVNAKLEEQESIAEAEQKLADEEAVKEAQEREEAIRAAIRVAEQSSKDVEEDELEEEEQEEERPEATPVVLDVAEEPEAEEEIPEEVQFSFEELAEIQEPEFVMETQSETQPKGRISFGIDDDDDDDDDDEPRLFFRRKKK